MATFVVVDDSDPFRSMLRRIVRDMGHEVVGEARNGREALDLINRLQPDAVTLDVSMPVMNGDLVAYDLLDRNVPITIFMVSSMSQQSVYEPLIERGVQFISKPYKPETVIKIITRGLHGKP